MIQLGVRYADEPSGIVLLRNTIESMFLDRCSGFSLERTDDPELNCTVALWRRHDNATAPDEEVYRDYIRFNDPCPLHLDDYDLVVDTFLEALSPALQSPPPDVPFGVDFVATVAVSERILVLTIRRETDRLFVSTSISDEEMGKLVVRLQDSGPVANADVPYGSRRKWWRFWRTSVG